VKQTGFVYSTDYGWTFSRDSALSAQGSKLGLVQFTGANEITASWFNINSGGTIVAKRAVATNVVAVRNRETIPFTCSPNPAQNLVTVQFTLPKTERVWLKLYSMLGQEVAQILDENLPAGEHKRLLDLSHELLGQSVYFLHLQTLTIFQQQTIQVLR